MEKVFGIIIGVIVLSFAALWFMSTYPQIFFALVVLGISVYIFRTLSKNQAEELKRQRMQLGQILAVSNESVIAFENIPKYLMSADQLIGAAENEFHEGAFSPFWDSIERAMQQLGIIETNIRRIAGCSSQYKQLMVSYSGFLPPFPVDPDAAHQLTAVGDVSARLHNIVRKAQRNFQFATIYEQRKTNTIIIAGFASVGEAISGLGAVLEQSIDGLANQIDDLSRSMNSMNEKMLNAVQDVSSATDNISAALKTADKNARSAMTGQAARADAVAAAIKSADKNAYAAMTSQAARQEKALRMLDNIQRHRVPGTLSGN